MNRPNFHNPDDTFSGVLVIVLVAVQVWFVLVKLPGLMGGVA